MSSIWFESLSSSSSSSSIIMPSNLLSRCRFDAGSPSELEDAEVEVVMLGLGRMGLLNGWG